MYNNCALLLFIYHLFPLSIIKSYSHYCTFLLYYPSLYNVKKVHYVGSRARPPLTFRIISVVFTT